MGGGGSCGVAAMIGSSGSVGSGGLCGDVYAWRIGFLPGAISTEVIVSADVDDEMVGCWLCTACMESMKAGVGEVESGGGGR